MKFCVKCKYFSLINTFGCTSPKTRHISSDPIGGVKEVWGVGLLILILWGLALYYEKAGII